MTKEHELLLRAVEMLRMWQEEHEYKSVKDFIEEISDFLSTPEPTQDDEPVAWISHNGFRFNADIEPIEHGLEVPLYLHPAPRSEFVRLAEDEVTEIVTSAYDMYAAICSVENRLVRKNSINRSDPDSIDLQSRCRGDKL